MRDARIVKVAEVLVDYSVGIKPGELVMIQGALAARPLLAALYRQVLKAGAHPQLQVITPETEEIRYREASDGQLAHISPVLEGLIDQMDVFIRVAAEENTRGLSSVDPSRRVLAARAFEPVSQRFRQRRQAGRLRAVVTRFPTQAQAQDAEMSLEEYEDFVFGACLPDPVDPIGFWHEISRQQAQLIAAMEGVQELRLVADGTDLRIGVAGRTFINCDGHFNYPDGEIFTGPQETAVDGTVRFSYPAVYRGVHVEDVWLRFQGGQVVEARAGKGQEFLDKMLDTDEGSRRLGEFAIGTNPGIARFTGQTLFDEKIKGTVHMALGSSYPESGGLNKSAIHWDMVTDLRSGGSIYADGRLIYQDGEFLPDFRAASGGNGHV